MNAASILGGTEKVKKYNHQVVQNPLVSICVVTYKHENLIHKCLDSILSQQTNFDFEILLGEDNSPDATQEICIDYAEKYPDKIRLFIHDRSNVITIGGRPTGRYNFMYNLLQAKGRYIAFCEGDDYWIDDKKLQKQVDFLEKHPEYMLCGGKWKVLRNDVKNEDIPGLQLKKNVFSPSDFITSDFIRIHLSTLMLRNCFDQINFPWEELKKFPVGDSALLFFFSLNGKTMRLDDFFSVYNKQNTTSLTFSRKMNSIESELINMFEVYDQYSNKQYHRLIEKEKEFIRKKVRMEKKELSRWQLFKFLFFHKKRFQYSFRDIIYIIRNYSKSN